MMHKKIISRGTLVLLIAGTCAGVARAQSNDALLNKLVSKGVLTQQEADELKKETDAGFDKAYRSRTALPDWVTSLKFYGDLRGRVDGIWTKNDAAASPGTGDVNRDRWRLRYRLRVGATTTLKDDLELGFRITSGEPASGGFDGNPISANTTAQDNGSKKFVYVDLAYGKWTPIHNDHWRASAAIGKIENPFSGSTMVFDDDYTPEGLALQTAYTFNKDHTLRMNGGFFWLQEIAQGGEAPNDAFMLGAQARWEAKWTPRVDSTLGLSLFAVTDEQSLTNFAVPNINVGNTRLANGTLLHDYTPVVVDAAITYTLDLLRTYHGKFPIRVAGAFMHNPGAPSENNAYEVGIIFGKAGKHDTWEFSYRWKRQEADSWFEEFTDSDFGAFYQVPRANSGSAAGYRGGTGIEGSIFKLSYSPYDALTLAVTYYLTDLIDPPVVTGRHTESSTSRLQVDAIWKF
jgi:hypothetical protein